MALRIELNGDKPGTVRFSAGKWKQSENVEIMVQRNQDSFYLSQLNQWVPETCWHPIADLTVNDQFLEGKIGPWLTDSLLALGGTCKFLMQVRECSNPALSDSGVVIIKPDVLPSNAVSTDIPVATIVPIVEPIPESVPEPEPEPIIEEVAAPSQQDDVAPAPSMVPPKKSKKTLISVIVVIILLLIGAGIAFMLLNKGDDPANNSTNSNDSGNCSLSQLNNNDEMELIQSCIRSQPSTEQILALIAEAKNQGKCNIAQRLYANQSQQNASIASVYAKEYDDKFYQKNSCFEADKDTAIYWYETALTLDPKNDVVKTRLAELKAK